MTEWHPLRSSENIVSASWKELDREAEENGRRCTSAALPSLRHASLKDYVNVYEPSDDTYLLLDGMLLDMESVLRYKDDSDCKDRHVVLEIGTGSGVPITFLTTQLIKNNAKVHAIATDINPKALEFAQKTAHENQVSIQTIQCDLATALLQEYAGKVDVIIFNPPYVPTPDEEVTGNGIEVSWAGGERGRRVIDRALPQLAQLLSKPRGICYMITVDDNEPEEIARALCTNYNLTMIPLVRRRAHNEYLTVQKITST